MRYTPEANSRGTGSSCVQSDVIAVSKTELEELVAAVETSGQAAEQAGKLAIAAAQAFVGEQRKLESYSSKLDEILNKS